MKRMLSTLTETKNKIFVEQRKLYVKYGGDKCNFVYLDNNKVILI